MPGSYIALCSSGQHTGTEATWKVHSEYVLGNNHNCGSLAVYFLFDQPTVGRGDSLSKDGSLQPLFVWG